MARQLLDVTIRHKGRKFVVLTVEADAKDPRELRKILADAIHRNGWDKSRIDEFDMEVRRHGDRAVLLTFAS
jgi:hypothetical protein